MQTRVGYVEMYTRENSGGPRLAPQNFVFIFIFILFCKDWRCCKIDRKTCVSTGFWEGILYVNIHMLFYVYLYIYLHIYNIISILSIHSMHQREKVPQKGNKNTENTQL